MIQQVLTDVFERFKINFYCEAFKRIHARETSLTTAEVFCIEIIYALHEPTVNEFAGYIKVSSPNAAYKVNSLIKKGYLEKVQSSEDKREFHLHVTSKYVKYYNLSQNYVNQVSKRIEERFSAEELSEFVRMLTIMRDELMPEVDIPEIDLSVAGQEGAFDE